MKTYRLNLKPLSSFLTPWQADTIFGSLCWLMTQREGENALLEFLQEYKNGQPAFILSDGMPGEYLPIPDHLSVVTSKGNSLHEFQNAKKLKKTLWVKAEAFEAIRKGQIAVQIEARIKAFKAATTLHSSINRMSGTTGDEGSLFELEEYALETKGAINETISIYIKIREGWQDKVFSLFKDLSLSGYGKKKSVGKGSFKIIGDLEDISGKFSALEKANGFISLSNFVPAKNDPTEGFYKTFVKYGKLGGEFTFCGKPFKKPLMMIKAGAVFMTDGPPKDFYGRMIEGISDEKKAVVQYGYAFAVPITL